MHGVRSTPAAVPDVAVLAGEPVEQIGVGSRGQALPRDERGAEVLPAADPRRARRRGMAEKPAHLRAKEARPLAVDLSRKNPGFPAAAFPVGLSVSSGHTGENPT